MTKRWKSQQDDSHGHNYFEKLNDKLFVESIFKKLSSNGADNSLNDIKALGQYSTVCKRFNALTCLVSKLCISHASIAVLCKYCPVILKKFKNVYSIQVKHWSCPVIQLMSRLEGLPVIHWEAAYKPHSYSLALISYKKQSWYLNHQQRQHLMRSDATRTDYCLSGLMREHCLDLICLHHMLVSSIRDHKSLQRVVVTDFRNLGTLTPKEDMLRELRDCRTINLKQVQVRDRSSSVINFDIPDVKEEFFGVVLNNLSFNIIEWWEKSTDDHIYNYKDDDDLNILLGLRQGILKHVLKSLLKNTDDIYIKFNDGGITLKVLSELMSDCKTPGYFC